MDEGFRREKPRFWVGSAKGDLLEFPEAVLDDIGVALGVGAVR
jgi:phage-related protein